MQNDLDYHRSTSNGSNTNNGQVFRWERLGERRVQDGINCSSILDRTNITQETHAQNPDDMDLYDLLGNCESYHANRAYTLTVSEEERDFPLAFSLLLFKDIYMAERLIRSVYRPSNYICVHLEKKSPNFSYRLLKRLETCLPNLFVLPIRYHVERYYISVIQPELACMVALWKYKFKYFINLTGQEFPAMTNLELVRALQAYNGRNVMSGEEVNQHSRFTRRIQYHLVGTTFEHRRARSALARVPPHNVTLMKGNVHIAATRGYVEYILHDPRVDDFLQW